MAWLGKVSLGNFSDIAEAVTKLSESVKNIEKNFDSALGFEEKHAIHEGQGASVERRLLVDPVLAFVGQKDASVSNLAIKLSPQSVAKPTEDSGDGQLGPENLSSTAIETSLMEHAASNRSVIYSEIHKEQNRISEGKDVTATSLLQDEPEHGQHVHTPMPMLKEVARTEDNHNTQDVNIVVKQENEGSIEEKMLCISTDLPGLCTEDPVASVGSNIIHSELHSWSGSGGFINQGRAPCEFDHEAAHNFQTSEFGEMPLVKLQELCNGPFDMQGDLLLHVQPSSQINLSSEVSSHDVEQLRAEVKMLEVALQSGAKQVQVKADEISRLLLENEQLRAAFEDLKAKSSDAELDALREEYKERLGVAERKVYALTKERDMLRREQNRKNDSSVLLKEKDEIIKQVMAEGEELSKKQAVLEAQMKKLRAQVREQEEEKQRLNSKLQVEEARVESIKKEKNALDKALQDAFERSQVELAMQKEFYTNALSKAKEAEARAEAQANSEAKMELEHRLREAMDRQAVLIQALEELRQALHQTEQQAAFHEDMLRRDNADLERRCQAAELRYEELVAHVPESTRPLLRQIEAMQESTAMRAEAWSGVERALNVRLQEAEARAAAATERVRVINERLTQTLSRMAVLEAQVSLLRAEQAQLTRSLEKERQRASENRQEYLAALEAAATQEGRAKQLEEEIAELRSRHKHELAEEKSLKAFLEKEVEHERKVRIEMEKQLNSENWTGTEKVATCLADSQPVNNFNSTLRKFSGFSSAGSVEESDILQSSLDYRLGQIPGGIGIASDPAATSSVGRAGKFTGTLEQLEVLLQQKERELASYVSRLAALESTRDSLAEDLVNTTTQCEKLRAEVASLPGLCAEMDALRRRHASALELMGERDEEVEELRADLADIKQMYREQIDMLVSQIEKLSASTGMR
eukprot:c22980_g1_i1 orf=618-3401(-)